MYCGTRRAFTNSPRDLYWTDAGKNELASSVINRKSHLGHAMKPSLIVYGIPYGIPENHAMVGFVACMVQPEPLSKKTSSHYDQNYEMYRRVSCYVEY